jgi:hypothetical protein
LVVLCFVPLAALQYRNARLPVLLMVVFVVLLIASGAIDLMAFTSRVGEFQETRSSGFQRFVSPFWLARQFFATATPPTLLFGNGPGTTDAFVGAHWYAGFAGTWLKLIYEYGLVGSFVFVCFFASCLLNSRCPRLVLVAIVFGYIFLGGELLDPSAVTTIIVLCTLSQRVPGCNQVDRDLIGSFGPPVALGSEAG